ncbi:MAG TPA: U32 family peptidase [Myxococcota bacterium]|nr:U32 family peptidase [Myxococcota bacterium]
MQGDNSSRIESLGMKLAVPYNHDRSLFTALAPFVSSIAEIFIPAPLDVSGTFRPWNGPDPAEYRSMVPDIVKRAGRLGLEVNMVINSPFVPRSDQPGVVEYVAVALGEGVASLTIGDLELAKRIRDVSPDVMLVASATADIATVMRARHWVRQAGIGRIVPSRQINKDLGALRAMAALGVELELIPNEQCLPGCPFIVAHCMTIATRDCVDRSEFEAWARRCLEMKVAAPWEQWQTEIVPASIPSYSGLVGLIKLAGRDSTTSEIVGEVERFSTMRSDAAMMLTGYVESPEAFDRVTTCDRVCERCGWCEQAFIRANPNFRDRIAKWDRRSPLPIS